MIRICLSSCRTWHICCRMELWTSLNHGQAWGGIPAWASSRDLLDSLSRNGLTPGDIDLILYTHLHNDHAGNANLFPATKSIAQKDEWENLLNPTYAELQRRDFDLDVVPYLKGNPNFIKIDGDLEIMEGIRLIKTPGHTRGSQSIVVNKKEGFATLWEIFSTCPAAASPG